MSEKHEERRQYKRIKKHFLLTYYELAAPSEKHDASQLKNISRGGMCLITAKPFPSATILGIELKTPFTAERVHLEGTVLGSHERIKDVIYETRMKFNPLTPQAEFVLGKLIQYFENEESK